MTAFAREDAKGEWGELTCELRSVNHRFLDVSVRLPEDLRSLEPLIRERIGARLSRGKIECGLRFKPAAKLAALEIDTALAKSVVGACHELESLMMNAARLSTMELIKWPGVVKEPEWDLGPAMETALDLLEKVIDGLSAMREREGDRIRNMLLMRCDRVAGIVVEQRQHRPQVYQKLKQKLEARLAELAVEPDPIRLEQELVFSAQRLDVGEELDRLDAHVSEVRQVLDRDEPVGRRLDFLMQELNRESNTLSSKSADAGTTQSAVELKVLIEQMREQVQNVE
jgi:uncharacterized protein (TIGR00255 family)